MKSENSIHISETTKIFFRVLKVLVIVLCVQLIGTFGFIFFEPDHNFLDAFYMSVITLSTVGYGLEMPLGPGAKIFISFFIPFGILVIFGYAISTLISIIVEGHIKNTFRDTKMEKKIGKLKNHIIVCGCGRLGSKAIKELEYWKKPYVIIEYDEAAANEMKEKGKLCIHGNAELDETLLQAGVESADGLISALSNDNNNLFVTLTARRLNKDLFIVSRAEFDNTKVKLLSAGANKVLSPAHIAGRRMASMIIHPEVSNFLDVVIESSELDLSLQEMSIRGNSDLNGLKIRDSHFPKDIKIIGIHPPGGTMIVNPDADELLIGGSTLILLGKNSTIDEFRKIHS